MEGVKIYKRPRLRDPYLIAAWPGMGEVAFKAASFLVEKLQGVEFAEILSEEFFFLTGGAVNEGILSMPALPEGKFYYIKNKTLASDLIVFLSNAQPDLAKAENYCERIISVAKSFRVKKVITFAAMPQATDHMHDAGVWFVSTSKETKDELLGLNLSLFKEGQISGMNGLFLGIAKQYGFDGFCLLGEIPLYTIQIENPKASAAVLGVLAKILKTEINTSGLIAQAHAMDEEINKLLDYLKLSPQQAGPISEDDIEKIKKSLSQLTKLPISVKEKIDLLFKQAGSDISKANELKAELDKWNVYKEYEDKFLDLFKKKEEGNN